MCFFVCDSVICVRQRSHFIKFSNQILVDKSAFALLAYILNTVLEYILFVRCFALFVSSFCGQKCLCVTSLIIYGTELLHFCTVLFVCCCTFQLFELQLMLLIWIGTFLAVSLSVNYSIVVLISVD